MINWSTDVFDWDLLKRTAIVCCDVFGKLLSLIAVGRATVLVFGKQVPAARAVRKAGMEGKRIQPSDNL